MPLNRVSLYLSIIGSIVLLIGVAVTADEFNKTVDYYHPRERSVLIVPVLGLVAMIYGLLTLRARRRPCPSCASFEVQRADRGIVRQFIGPFQNALHCRSCDLDWVTACPTWIGVVTLAL